YSVPRRLARRERPGARLRGRPGSRDRRRRSRTEESRRWAPVRRRRFPTSSLPASTRSASHRRNASLVALPEFPIGGRRTEVGGGQTPYFGFIPLSPVVIYSARCAPDLSSNSEHFTMRQILLPPALGFSILLLTGALDRQTLYSNPSA